MGLSTVPASTRLVETPSEPHHVSSTVYGSSIATEGLPRFEMGEDEMEPRLVKRFIEDELLGDANPSLNLASFVTTYMEPEAEELMAKHANVNMVDVEEYPSTAEIEKRCVSFLARVWNAPVHSAEEEALGVSTVGSSEAIILATLAAKRKWQNKRRLEGKSIDNPNLVLSSCVQVCWEKAARYLEVEERYWYASEGKYVADPAELVALVDENTILVCAILGTTYTGQYEDVQAIDELLQLHNKKHGLDVGIHVDAASGGFVAPFVNPNLVWDFRLPTVVSINASGHKYGLVYCGVGWCIWRGKEHLPDEIIFTVNYLGSPQSSVTLNFSKGASQVIGQYYQFLRLGKSGYRAIMTSLTRISDRLADEIKNMNDGKLFEILSDGGGTGLPLVAWRLKKDTERAFDEFAIAAHLRQRGWIVPAYTLAPHADKIKLLRVVVREDFSQSRSLTFVRDLKETISYLSEAPAAVQKHLTEKSKSPHHKNHHHNASNHVKVDDSHSLQGKHGKTHAVC